jgi:hypothetical protein
LWSHLKVLNYFSGCGSAMSAARRSRLRANSHRQDDEILQRCRNLVVLLVPRAPGECPPDRGTCPPEHIIADVAV